MCHYFEVCFYWEVVLDFRFGHWKCPNREWEKGHISSERGNTLYKCFSWQAYHWFFAPLRQRPFHTLPKGSVAFPILTRFPLFLTLLIGLSILFMSCARTLVFAKSVLIVQHGQACVLHSIRSLLHFLGDLLQIFHCFLQPKILQAFVKDLATLTRFKAITSLPLSAAATYQNLVVVVPHSQHQSQHHFHFHFQKRWKAQIKSVQK